MNRQRVVNHVYQRSLSDLQNRVHQSFTKNLKSHVGGSVPHDGTTFKDPWSGSLDQGTRIVRRNIGPLGLLRLRPPDHCSETLHNHILRMHLCPGQSTTYWTCQRVRSVTESSRDPK